MLPPIRRASRAVAICCFAAGVVTLCAPLDPAAWAADATRAADRAAIPIVREIAAPEGEPAPRCDEPSAPPSPALVDTADTEQCPAGMNLVEGAYCPVASQPCVKWMEDPGQYSYARCAAFDRNPTCLSAREQRRFCIDAHEYTLDGDTLPATSVSFNAAEKLCQEQGKRLCQESEWEFACEGEALLPYPYGFVRDSSACNFEKTALYEPSGDLRDLREPSGSRPRCSSPFGVEDMVGNVDEWTVRESGVPHRSALRGGWWMPGRNRCRAATTAHDEIYKGPQTGFRCCAWPR